MFSKKNLAKISGGYQAVFSLIVICLGMVLQSRCTFIELRIYPPIPEKTHQKWVASPRRLVWVDETQLGENLGYHRPYLFPVRPLANRYGSLISILEREVNENPESYPLVESGLIREVRIRIFRLQSIDSCWTNRVSLELWVEILQEGRIRVVEYRDEILSHVTDCFLVGSSITIVPLLWYIPYMGFRGNREDQLNQLGRNAILVILKALKETE